MMLALHGFTGGGSDFAPLVEAMPEWPWLTPDLPGHAPDPNAAGAAGDDCNVEASIRYLDDKMAAAPGRTHVLLGYSMGGRLALHYALARPRRVAALILIGTSAGLGDATERASRRTEDEALAKEILAQGVPVLLERWQQRPLIATQQRLPPPWRAAMQERRLRLRTEGLAASLRGMGQGALEAVWERLLELKMPVLICAGAEDEKYMALAAKMLVKIPSAELFIMPAAGHMAHLENREAFVAGLREFLQKHHLTPMKT